MQKIELTLAVILISASVAGAGLVLVRSPHNINSRQVFLEAFDTTGAHFTDARTVGDFLNELGIEYSEQDRIEPGPDVMLKPGMRVEYAHAVKVYIADAGKGSEELISSCETVCDLFTEINLDIRTLDRVDPPVETKLEEDMLIEITRVEVYDITSEHEVEPPVIFQADQDMPRGQVQEIEPGKPGIKEDITRVFIKNGRESVRHWLRSRVIKEPTSRILKVGTRALPALASRGGNARHVMSMVATAYDPGPASCAPFADGLTATGRNAGRGIAAVDPKVIPLGSHLWIEDYGYAVAADTGGAIKGNRIDVCFETRGEAMRWGRRTVLVYIID